MIRTREEWDKFCERGTSGDQVWDILSDWRESEQGWIDAESRQPKHDGPVLTYGDDDKIRIDRCVQGAWIMEYIDHYGTLCWMPLPEPPEEQ